MTDVEMETYHFGALPRAESSKAQPRGSWSEGRGICKFWREIGGFYEGVRRVKKVRLGAWLEICRLQLPYLDFQLHPPYRLNGRGKITSELLCLLPFLWSEEQKLVVGSPLLALSVNWPSFRQENSRHMPIRISKESEILIMPHYE